MYGTLPTQTRTCHRAEQRSKNVGSGRYFDGMGCRWRRTGAVRSSGTKSMKRILVIDDDSAVMAMTTRALRAHGFHTLTADNGVAGLEMAKQNLPDMIICDIQMPQLNGYETLAALRLDPATAAIPFIFLTGMTERKQVRQGMGLGADDYLTKPFTVQELIGAVKTRLEKLVAVQLRSEKKLEE